MLKVKDVIAMLSKFDGDTSVMIENPHPVIHTELFLTDITSIEELTFLDERTGVRVNVAALLIEPYYMKRLNDN